MNMNETNMDYDQLDPASLDFAGRYKRLAAAVVPRSMALVTSVGRTGLVKAAPFSRFVIIAVDTPLLGIVVGLGLRGEKDKLANTRARGECVINTVPASLEHQVQQCAQPYPPEVSEIYADGLDLASSLRVSTPRIRQSRLQFECRFQRLVEFGVRTSALAVGKVAIVHAVPGLLRGHRADHAAFDPLGRIGGRRFLPQRPGDRYLSNPSRAVSSRPCFKWRKS